VSRGLSSSFEFTVEDISPPITKGDVSPIAAALALWQMFVDAKGKFQYPRFFSRVGGHEGIPQ
jgi:hypothetical protein